MLATVAYVATGPGQHGWMLGVGCVVLGAGALFVGQQVAAVERRRGAQVLIAGKRYYLAH